jgi:hypothetical protein
MKKGAAYQFCGMRGKDSKDSYLYMIFTYIGYYSLLKESTGLAIAALIV